MLRTGLVSITFRPLSAEDVLALAARAGVDAIEWGGDIHVPLGDIPRAQEVGEKTREAGLAVAAYGSYVRMTREEAEKGDLERAADTAYTLGAPLIRVWAGNKGSAEATDSDWQEIVENTRLLAKFSKERNMDVAFEYHGHTLTDSMESADRLLREVGCENVGSLWQPPVRMGQEDCLRGIARIAPYLRNVHTFSWNGTEKLPLCEGEAAWRRYIQAIEAIPGDRYMLIEFVRDGREQQFVEDAATLRKWLEER